MSNQDTDHAAVPCPLYAGGECGLPHPTTTTTTVAVSHPSGTIPFTGSDVGPALAVAFLTAGFGIILARVFRTVLRK